MGSKRGDNKQDAGVRFATVRHAPRFIEPVPSTPPAPHALAVACMGRFAHCLSAAGFVVRWFCANSITRNLTPDIIRDIAKDITRSNADDTGQYEPL